MAADTLSALSFLSFQFVHITNRLGNLEIWQSAKLAVRAFTMSRGKPWDLSLWFFSQDASVVAENVSRMGRQHNPKKSSRRVSENDAAMQLFSCVLWGFNFYGWKCGICVQKSWCRHDADMMQKDVEKNFESKREHSKKRLGYLDYFGLDVYILFLTPLLDSSGI